MYNQVSRRAAAVMEPVDRSALAHINGGQYDYSNRLGLLGQHLESRPGHNYGVSLHPKNLEEAAAQALQGWVSIP